jgi:hypothetical protein
MRKVLFILAIALTAWPGSAALAQGHARERVRAGDVVPLDRILPQIRRAHPGSFYDAQGPFPDSRGGYYYRLKWLTPDGRVIWLDTDARTGRVMSSDRFRGRDEYDEPDRGFYDRGREPDARGRDERRGRHGDSVRPHNGFRDDEAPRGFYDDRRGGRPGGGFEHGHGHGGWGGGRDRGDGHRGHGGF